MPKKSVDKLSTEELERLLMIRRREERIARYRRSQRIESNDPAALSKPLASAAPSSTIPVLNPMDATVLDIPTQSRPISRKSAAKDTVADYSEVRFVEDEPAPTATARTVQGRQPRQQVKKILQNRRVNTFLLLVEIASIVGLVVVLGVAFWQLAIIDDTRNDILDTSNKTQQELEEAFKSRQATPSPMPELTSMVLPGGHIWSDVGNHQFNYNEVPPGIRSAVRTQIENYQPVQYETFPDDPRLIRINKIGVNHSIIPGDDWQSLQAAVGYQLGSGTPTSGTNMVLTAHNDIYGEIFRGLPELREGDEIQIETADGIYTYRVKAYQQVEPTDVWVMGPEVADLTLITCHPYRVNTHRWVVFAERIN